MAGIGDYILKILKKLDEIEKKIDVLNDSMAVNLDFSSRDDRDL